MNLNFKYKSLVESLKLLSCTEDEQRKLLPDFVVLEDEVLSLFDDAFLLSPELIENDLLPNQAIASMIRCNNFIDISLGKWEKLDENEIKEFWVKLKDLATITLVKMGEKPGIPDAEFLNWNE